jgi:hypothetical protein
MKKVIKVKTFLNKRTKQISIVLPKKKIHFTKVPKELSIRIVGKKW